MTLLQVRTQVINLSGRWNLGVDPGGGDYSDNGADFFIQAAQRYILGRPEFSIESLRSSGIYDIALTSGEYTNLLGSAIRVIKRIAVVDPAEDTQTYLTARTYEWMVEEYGDEESFADVDADEPTNWAVIPSRVGSSDSDATKSGMTLITMPPADGSYTLKVECVLSAEALAVDADTNFLTLQYPEILISGALWQIESYYRNSQGAADHKAHLDEMLNSYFIDDVRQEAHDWLKKSVLW